MTAFLGAQSYDYIFEGQAGSLSHMLTSPSLTGQVVGLLEWHVNAAEPRAFDYNDFNQPLLYSPDQFRSADHEPLIMGLDLAEPKPVPASSPATLLLLLAALVLGYRRSIRRQG